MVGLSGLQFSSGCAGTLRK